MSSHQGVRFNDPPVTDYNSMDVDDTSGSLISQDDLYLGPDDDLYLGPDDDLEDDSVSSSHPDMFHAIPDQFPPAEADDQHLLPIDQDLYLGPDHDLIDCDEDIDVPAVPEVPKAINATSTGSRSPPPELTNEDLLTMVQEFRPFGSFEHSTLDTIQDRLSHYINENGKLPDPTIPQQLEAERPFRMAWAETSDKLRRAGADLASLEMLKVVDSLIRQIEDSN
ncbi:hypothetical protein P692DRAFT_20948152 [Suillus brevipes Sb2]|nr:hypothetical protein P692DRAFT_20948152 [Suillus brevipes Sb2]